MLKFFLYFNLLCIGFVVSGALSYCVSDSKYCIELFENDAEEKESEENKSEKEWKNLIDDFNASNLYFFNYLKNNNTNSFTLNDFHLSEVQTPPPEFL